MALSCGIAPPKRTRTVSLDEVACSVSGDYQVHPYIGAAIHGEQWHYTRETGYVQCGQIKSVKDC